jgi:hypothetical protein
LVRLKSSRKICVENYIYVGDQGSEDNIPPQEEAEMEEHEEKKSRRRNTNKKIMSIN